MYFFMIRSNTDQCLVRKITSVVAGCAALLVSASALANEDVAARLDEVVQSAVDVGRFSGAILLARNGEIILDKAFGYANWEDASSPLTPRTPFNIGSIGKLFTQALVLEKVETGEWRLDQTITELWPESGIPNAKHIRLEHLLSHTSGLGNYFGHSEYGLEQRTLADFIELVQTQPLRFEVPGSDSYYSNSAYWVLAALLERHDSQQRGWQQMFQDEIFEPAGMTGVRFLQPDEAALERPRGYFHNPLGERSDRTEREPRPGPDGGLYMTTHDLLAFHRQLETHTWYGEALHEETLAFRAPFILEGCHFGLTWEVCDLGEVQLVTKGGTTENGGAEYVRFTYQGDNYALIMLSNFSNAPLMLFQDMLAYATGVPGARLISERPAVIVHQGIENGELPAMQANFYRWADSHEFTPNPLDNYVLAHHYSKTGDLARARALLTINVKTFEGHPLSAQMLASLKTQDREKPES